MLVTKTEDGEVDSCEIEIGVVLDSLPEWDTVLRELSLTSSRGNEHNVLLGGQVLQRIILHGHDGGLQATCTATVAEAFSKGGRVAVVRSEENGERSTEKTL